MSIGEASSSSFLPLRSSFSCKYRVFLSSGAEYNHNNFVDHLYEKLRFEEIHTAKSNETLEFPKTIEQSRILVVISENYVSSACLLDELVKIIDCWETNGKIVIPIFYDVDPIDVRDQSGRITEALVKHEEFFKKLEKVKKWEDALTKLTSICGWNSCQWEEDTIFIEQIVRDISDKVLHTSSRDTNDLVGMGSHITEMEKRLCLDSNTIHTVGLWGMGAGWDR